MLVSFDLNYFDMLRRLRSDDLCRLGEDLRYRSRVETGTTLSVRICGDTTFEKC